MHVNASMKKGNSFSSSHANIYFALDILEQKLSKHNRQKVSIYFVLCKWSMIATIAQCKECVCSFCGDFSLLVKPKKDCSAQLIAVLKLYFPHC